MSVNVSKQQRDALLQKIEELRAGIANDPRLQAHLDELSNVIGTAKYGLVFEQHQEEIEDLLLTHAPVLTEDTALRLDGNGTDNLLIEGDNLAALQVLGASHAGKIDVIYIDPPYNTGNKDFLFGDSFVTGDDAFRHSKWLSFMEKRLRLAIDLLSESGVIFISIDDNEMTHLKMLCDDIFGSHNFVAVLPRVTKKSGKDHTNSIAQNHDYVVVYAKDKSQPVFCGLPSHEDGYPLYDEYFPIRGGYKLNQTLDYDSLWYNENMDFPLTINGQTFVPGGSMEQHEKRHAGEHKQKDWVWRWSKEKFDFGYENGFVVIKQGRDGNPRIYTKTYAKATISNTRPYEVVYKDRETPLSSIALTDNRFSNDNAKKEITKLGLENFGFPKPTALVEQLLSIVRRADTVLDFFAGSGTTGHAVMKLNAADGGHRTFILCTNNENNICREVTYERIKRAIEKNGYQANLRYCKVDYQPKPET